MRARTSWIPVVLALGVVGALSGCGRTTPFGDGPRACVFDRDCPEGLRCVNSVCQVVPDAGAGGWKQFGEPCEDRGECQSGYCLGGPRGSFCSIGCDGECPSGFACKMVPDPSLASDAGTPPIALCALPQPLLCQPCTEDSDCGGSGGDHCLPSGLYGFCGQDCTFDGCPDGYACTDTPRGLQCAPQAGHCDCTPEDEGRLRGCALENDAGRCFGAQICGADGQWGACSARTAVAEDCNGVDDDCDGFVDELDDLPVRTCSRSGSAGTCTGPESCQGAAGWRCDAPTPVTESCNYVDDDCDGTVDETFVNAQGLYVQKAHCGGCGNDCAALLPNATQTRCAVDAQGAPSCFADACAAGFVPSKDGRQCIKLADSLCQACTQDSDCAGPGSRCLTHNGERFCGRPCGPGSAWTSCPSGYVCSTTSVGQQCLPSNGTCQCTSAQLGNTRSCTVQSCNGYELCQNTGSGAAWSTCDVASFNPELCDAVDNDCDGLVDEGFRNPVSGRYETTAHCGFCNNDCSKYWSPTLHHTTGVCDTTTTFPTCKMGACTTETVGGTVFEWRDVNGDTQDGCECRRVKGNTSSDEPQELAPFIDENCDGIDGVIGDALFVWAGAATSGNGSITTPFRTISQAVSAFPTSGRKYILVAEGTYTENLLVPPGVRLYGGYARDFKKRDPVLHTSNVVGVIPISQALNVAQAAIHVRNAGATIASRVVVAGFTLRGVDILTSTPDDQDGRASITVLVENAGQHVRIVSNEILAGRGARGGRGTSGAQGHGRQVSTLLNGQNGLNGVNQNAPCPFGFSRFGGAGGANGTCGGANGNTGGGVGCPQFNWNTTPVQGAQSAFPPNNGRNGEGGFDWSFDATSFSCSHVTESGFPSNIQTHDGRDGEDGADGQVGAAGQGAPNRARYGSIQNGRWVSANVGASAGATGAPAQGGGGGGAGGGTAHFPGGPCQLFEAGATGGGGGAGGCGGVGGRPGRAGGASIAVLVTFTLPPLSGTAPVVSDNRIGRNVGGDGGNGGFGGAGGLGGFGGVGGTPTRWHGSTGGKGGEGGNGGVGGGGGGGAGGPSFGVLTFNAGTATYAQNAFLTPATSNTGGKGGTGGSSSGAGTGTAGVDGASANLFELRPCLTGCPGGFSCDSNGVCVPP